MALQAATVTAKPERLRPDDVLGGNPETRIVDLLTFAMAAERGIRQAGPELDALRQRAEADLQADMMRRLHNQVERIRHQALLDGLERLPKPPGFFRLVLASTLGCLVAAGGLLWMLGGTPDFASLEPHLAAIPDRVGTAARDLTEAGSRLLRETGF